MDRGRSSKVKGDYSTAYKLAGSTIDKKTLRLHRRSIEQKELRLDEHNKRRNIADLSPVQEGDQTLSQNKSYKGQTPVKRKVGESGKASKGLDRLEQLKKWKEERELKRKLETGSTNKRNPVFRVSKTLEHGDQKLFKKQRNGAMSKHPVKPQSAPVAVKKSKTVTSAPPKTAVTSNTRSRTDTRSIATKQLLGSNTQTNSSSRGASKQAPSTSKPVKKTQGSLPTLQSTRPIATSTRTTRAARFTAPEPSQRMTRQSARNKVLDAPTNSAPKPDTAKFVKPESEIDYKKVSTKRGGGDLDSFAPCDFTFNTSSFVFKPLSPSSAAGFLYPNQDMSSSFLETNPKRSSTPNRDEGVARSAQDVDKVTDKCNNTLLLERTGMNMTDTTQLNLTRRESADKTLVNILDKSSSSRRRSMRNSSGSQRSAANVDDNDSAIESATSMSETEIEDESGLNKSKTVEKSRQTPTRRSLRRSILSSTASQEDVVVVADGTPMTKSQNTCDNLHKSILPSSTADNENSAEETQTVRSTKLRRSLRRSILTSSESDNTETSREEVSTPMKGRHRSVRNSVAMNVEPTCGAETPPRSSRRSSRRSVVSTPEVNIIPEEQDTVVEMDCVFDDKQTTESPLKKSQSPQPLSFDSCAGRNLPALDKETPNKSQRKKRNKSFGGFRLPNADSAVLSAKRKGRKSMMPKSPEEWVNLLNHSPMVEMSRRTPKAGNMSMPVLNFDDIDLEDPNTSLQYVEKESNEVTAMETDEAAAVSTSKAVDDMAETVKQASMETVQVGEVSSTQDEPLDGGSDDHDVRYFRNLLISETRRLKNISIHWEEINSDTANISEEIRGQIRTTVGQALLLMDQRFKQFSGLVDNCEFKTGEKETTCTDLQGFWDMIYFQVEDVDAKFADLAKLQTNNWIDDKPKPIVKKIKKKVTKPVPTKAAAKSKFAAFRAQMKKQKQEPVDGGEEEVEKVFEAPGFFRVASPIRTPKPHCEAGSTPKKITPVTALKDGSAEVINRTPARRSYLPAVPSPLLHDITPLPRTKRTSTLKTPIPKRLLEDAEQPALSCDNEELGEIEDSNSKRVKTSARRSLRTRKSVNFSEEVTTKDCASPVAMGTDDEFARLLQPIVAPQETMEPESADVVNDSFSKYLMPTKTLDTSMEKENTMKQTRKRRSSLKECRSTERRRSRSRNVHFNSPVMEDVSHVKLPHTPYNKDSLVRLGRVKKRSLSEVADVFSIDNVDNDENSPKRSFRSPRPSLLFTPPEMKRSPRITRNVPTATLISFSP